MNFAEALKMAKSGAVVTHKDFYRASGLRWSDYKGGKFHTVDELGFKYQWWPLKKDRQAEWFILSSPEPPR